MSNIRRQLPPEEAAPFLTALGNAFDAGERIEAREQIARWKAAGRHTVTSDERPEPPKGAA